MTQIRLVLIEKKCTLLKLFCLKMRYDNLSYQYINNHVLSIYFRIFTFCVLRTNEVKHMHISTTIETI